MKCICYHFSPTRKFCLNCRYGRVHERRQSVTNVHCPYRERMVVIGSVTLAVAHEISNYLEEIGER